MRYRFDPLYPAGRHDPSTLDARLRGSDAERNDVADRLAHHFADGRLDETEFKGRLDAAMSATTRGDLHGLFDDLPRLPSERPPAPPRRRQLLPWLLLIVIAMVALAAGAAVYEGPFLHVPWLVLAVVAFVLWRRSGRHHAADPFHR